MSKIFCAILVLILACLAMVDIASSENLTDYVLKARITGLVLGPGLIMPEVELPAHPFGPPNRGPKYAAMAEYPIFDGY